MSAVETATTPKQTASGAAWRSVLRSAGVRVLVLPVSAVLGIVVTRLIIENYGQAAYAQYGLLVGLGTLLPFADLGMSAAVMNSVAGSDDPARDLHVRRVLTTAIRVLFSSATVAILVAVAFAVSGVWPSLLGEGLLASSGPLAATLCLAGIAVTMPMGLGQRIVTGLGRNHISIALLGLQTPLVLATLLLMIALNTGGGGYVAVVPYVATFVLSVVCTWIASRKISPAVTQAFKAAPHPRREPGEPVFDVAWPMLVQMIALPIAMQTDRIVLSHLSDLKNLAQYNLASQMYTPIWQVVSAAGVALWPIFARSRAKGTIGPSPFPLALGFGAAALGVAGVITAVSGWLSNLASGGEIHLPVSLLVAFSVFMVFQATKYPLGMYITDARGLRFQALMIVTLLPVNLGLSLLLASRYGAVGPVVGSAVGVLICQVVANWIYISRRRAREAAELPVPQAAAQETKDAE